VTELQIGDQTIRYDSEATAAIYAARAHGYAEKCGCVFCRNFAAQRERVYPAPFRALLEQLGIDPAKEDESVAYGPLKDGCHFWGGWFYCVAEMVVWGEGICEPPDAHEFQFFFTTTGPWAKEFPGRPLLGIEFMAHVEWVLAESPDYVRAKPQNSG
jgi:hypothetical protein